MTDIKKVLQCMLEDNEFDKIIKTAKGKEKRKAKEFYEAIKDLKEEDWKNIPMLIIIQACKSYYVWQDIWCYMGLIENDKQDTKKSKKV